MELPLGARIAWRYLVTKKANGAIGTITGISIAATAVATAAIVCVLSVFNGFQDVISARLDTLSPQLAVKSTDGRIFSLTDSLLSLVKETKGVEAVSPTLSDNALVIFNSQEMPVKLKGVDPQTYASVTDIKKVIPPDWGSYPSDGKGAIVSIGVASRLQIYPGDQLLVFTPKREGRVNPANPATSFLTDSIEVSGIYRTDQSKFDDDGLIVPLSLARMLFETYDGATALEIKTQPGEDATRVRKRLGEKLGKDFTVNDRLMQQADNFRMIKVEKWISFLLLAFILVIASFNLISSLAMIVIEKQRSLKALRALGLSRRATGAIFAWESLYVSLIGGIFGIVLGVILCWLQQEFGIIKFSGTPGATIIDAYPVRVEGRDLLAVVIPIGMIAFVTGLLTSTFAQRRTANLTQQ